MFYGEPFRANDVISVYVDLVDGLLFFAKNGEIYGDAFADTPALKDPNKVFYAACCCLTKGESFELMVPACED
jgi:hypothetical protein